MKESVLAGVLILSSICLLSKPTQAQPKQEDSSYLPLIADLAQRVITQVESPSEPSSTLPQSPAPLRLELSGDAAQTYGGAAIKAGISPDLFDNALETYRKVAADEGLPPDQLATGLTFFLYVNYVIATGQSEDTLDMTTIYNQVRSSLEADRNLQTQHRQDAEGFGALSAMYTISITEAEQQRDIQRQQRLRQTAQNNLKSILGVQPDQIHVTQQGFVIQ